MLLFIFFTNLYDTDTVRCLKHCLPNRPEIHLFIYFISFKTVKYFATYIDLRVPLLNMVSDTKFG